MPAPIRRIAKPNIGFDTMTRLALELPPEFIALCQADGIEPETVLRGFIADLCQLHTDNYPSHGADERALARAYYERVGYPYWQAWGLQPDDSSDP